MERTARRLRAFHVATASEACVASSLGGARVGADDAAMPALRTPAKVGFVVFGVVVAFGAAWIAVDLRQRMIPLADQSASSGMYAFGDLLSGVAVFGVVALVPLALTLYWLRSVNWFWTTIVSCALLFAATGPFAVLVGGWMQPKANSWVLLLAFARVGAMPLSALACFTTACFAPQTRQRWLLAAVGALEAVLFGGVVLFRFVLPALRH